MFTVPETDYKITTWKMLQKPRVKSQKYANSKGFQNMAKAWRREGARKSWSMGSSYRKQER